MGRYAPGTMGFDLANNAGGSKARRRADIASGLEGLGGLFSTLAGINQRMQARADEQAAMPYLARAYADPYDQGQPGVYGPQRPVMQEAMDTASMQETPGFFQNVGSAFGFGQRQGRITPATLGQIGAVQQRGQDQAMQMAQEQRAAELQPFRVAEARNTIRQQDTNYQQDVEEFPERMEALKTGAAAAKQRMAQAGADFEMAREKNAAQIDYLKASAEAKRRPGGSSAVRPDILAGKLRQAQQRYSAMSNAYRLRKQVDRGEVDIADSELGADTVYGAQSADSLREMMTNQLREIDALTGGEGSAPQPVPATTGPQSNAAPIEDDTESTLTSGGTDTEMMQAIAAFKAQHPGAPFDSAAFMGWLSSGR